MLIASERGAELPLVKLADFGVSLLTAEGSGPVALLGARKPSSASLRGAILPPPSAESPSLTRGLPTQDLYAVGDDEDDNADTGSLMSFDYGELGTASMLRTDLQPGDRMASPAGSVVSISGVARAVAASRGRVPPEPRGPQAAPAESKTLEMTAAQEDSDEVELGPRLDSGDVRTVQRPSQGSLSELLAAAPDDSVVVADLLTQTDALIGTPMYMAPELWNSGSHRAEPLSDIFSVGVIAFELLTGRMPFAVPPVMSRANDEPIYITRLSQIRPDLEPRLIALIESCLALNPDSRLRASELTKRLIELGAQSPQG